MTTGTQIRDFCSVDDIAKSRLAGDREKAGASLIEKFNLGSGCSIPLRDLVTGGLQELGIAPELRFGEVPMHPYEPHHSVADITQARGRLLGWEPRHRLSHAVWNSHARPIPTLVCKEPERNARPL